MNTVWAKHGTKIVGALVTVLSGIAALNSDQLSQLFGKTWAPFLALTVGGLLTVIRGFQGPKQNPPPSDFEQLNSSHPPREQGFIDREVILLVAAIALCLAGCALLAQTPLDGKIGVAKESVASIERAAATAVQAGTLDASTGQEIYTDAQSTVKYLNGAHAAVVAGNQAEGAAQYALANQLLGALQTYVNSHLPKAK